MYREKLETSFEVLERLEKSKLSKKTSSYLPFCVLIVARKNGFILIARVFEYLFFNDHDSLCCLPLFIYRLIFE